MIDKKTQELKVGPAEYPQISAKDYKKNKVLKNSFFKTIAATVAFTFACQQVLYGVDLGSLTYQHERFVEEQGLSAIDFIEQIKQERESLARQHQIQNLIDYAHEKSHTNVSMNIFGVDVYKEITLSEMREQAKRAADVGQRASKGIYGVNYIKYPDGMVVWLKDELPYKILNERVEDKHGLVSIRDTYEMKYNEKRLLVSYDAKIKDVFGNVYTIQWKNAQYTPDSVYYANEKTNANKNIVYYEETVTDQRTGQITSRVFDNAVYDGKRLASYRETIKDSKYPDKITVRQRSGCGYDGDNNPTSYKEVLTEKIKAEDGNWYDIITTRIFKGGNYDSKGNLLSYRETITDSWGTRQTEFKAKYDGNSNLSWYSRTETYGTGVSIKKEFKGIYDSKTRLVESWETTTDPNYSGYKIVKHWKTGTDTQKGYDQYNRLNYYVEEIEYEQGKKETRTWYNPVYNNIDQLLSYSELITDITGMQIQKQWQVFDPNNPYNGLGQITGFTETITAGQLTIVSTTKNIKRDSLGQFAEFEETYTANGTDSQNNVINYTRTTKRTQAGYNSSYQLIRYNESITEFATDQNNAAILDLNTQIQRTNVTLQGYNEHKVIQGFDSNANLIYNKTTDTVRTDVYYNENREVVGYKDRITDPAFSNLVMETTTKGMQYNGLGQVVKYVEETFSSASPGNGSDKTVRYLNWASYNGLGQIVACNEKITSLLGLTTDITTENITYNAANQRTSYKETSRTTAQDPNGNSIDLTTTTQRNSIQYDIAGRLLYYKEQQDTQGQDRRSEVEWQALQYDNQGRLIQYKEKTRQSGPGLDITVEVTKSNINYDNFGRITSCVDTIKNTATPNLQITKTTNYNSYNSFGQATSYTERIQEVDINIGLNTTIDNIRTNIIYNSFGQLVSYHEESISSQSASAKTVTDYSDAKYDSFGRLLSFTRRDQRISSNDNGATLYVDTTLVQDQMLYNNLGQLESYSQRINTRFPGSNLQSQEINKQITEVRYNSLDQMTSFRERSATTIGTLVLEINSHRENIAYNGLGQMTSYRETSTNSQAEGLATVVNWSGAVYDNQGMILSFTKQEQKTALDNTLTLDTTIQESSRAYNSFGQLIYYRQTVTASFPGTNLAPLVSSIETKNITYNSAELMKSYEEKETVTYSDGTSTLTQTTKTERSDIEYNALGLADSYTEDIEITNTAGLKSIIHKQWYDATYDLKGLLVSFKEELGRTDTSGTLLQETIERNQRTNITYDNKGLVLSYDQDGWTSSSGAYQKSWQAKGYDIFGRITAYQEEGFSASGGTYKIERSSIAYQRLAGQDRIVFYNEQGIAQGQVYTKAWYAGTKTSAQGSYNVNGELLSFWEEGFNSSEGKYTLSQTQMQYNGLSQLVSYSRVATNPLGATKNITWQNALYDIAGRLVYYQQTQTEQSGKTIQTTWQANGFNSNGQLMEYTRTDRARVQGLLDETTTTNWQASYGDSYSDRGLLFHYRQTSQSSDSVSGLTKTSEIEFKQATYNDLGQLTGFIQDEHVQAQANPQSLAQLYNSLAQEEKDAYRAIYDGGLTLDIRTTTNRQAMEYNDKGLLIYYNEVFESSAETSATRTVWSARNSDSYDSFGLLRNYEQTRQVSGSVISQKREAIQYDQELKITAYKETTVQDNFTSIVQAKDITYDGLGRQTNITKDINEYDTKTQGQQLSRNSQVKQENITYNPLGQLSSYTETTTHDTDKVTTINNMQGILYDEKGRQSAYILQSQRKGEGATQAYRLGDNGELALEEAVARLDETSLGIRYGITYNDMGQVSGYTETQKIGQVMTKTQTQGILYDDKQRIIASTSTITRQDTNILQQITSQRTGIAYDDLNRITGYTEIQTNGQNVTKTQVSNITYDSKQREESKTISTSIKDGGNFIFSSSVQRSQIEYNELSQVTGYTDTIKEPSLSIDDLTRIEETSGITYNQNGQITSQLISSSYTGDGIRTIHTYNGSALTSQVLENLLKQNPGKTLSELVELGIIKQQEQALHDIRAPSYSSFKYDISYNSFGSESTYKEVTSNPDSGKTFTEVKETTYNANGDISSQRTESISYLLDGTTSSKQEISTFVYSSPGILSRIESSASIAEKDQKNNQSTYTTTQVQNYQIIAGQRKLVSSRATSDYTLSDGKVGRTVQDTEYNYSQNGALQKALSSIERSEEDTFGNTSSSQSQQILDIINNQTKVVASYTLGTANNVDGSTTQTKDYITYSYDNDGKLIAAEGRGSSLADDGFGNTTASKSVQEYIVNNQKVLLARNATDSTTTNLDGSSSTSHIAVDYTYSGSSLESARGAGTSTYDDGFGNITNSTIAQEYTIIDQKAYLSKSITNSTSQNSDRSTKISTTTTTYTYSTTGLMLSAESTGQSHGTDAKGNTFTSATNQDYIIINNQAYVSYMEEERVLTAKDSSWTNTSLTKWRAGDGSGNDVNAAFDEHCKNIKYHQETTETGTGSLQGLNRLTVIDWAAAQDLQGDYFTAVGGWVLGYTQTTVTKDFDANSNIICQQQSTITRTDIEYYAAGDRQPAGKMKSYTDYVISGDSQGKATQISTTNIKYDRFGRVISQDSQSTETDIQNTVPSVINTTYTTRENIAYDDYGQQISWQEVSNATSAADKGEVKNVSVRYDELGRVVYSEYQINEKSISDDGASLDKAYTVIKDNIQYNVLGQALSWTQLQQGSTDAPSLINESTVTATYDELGRMQSYNEEGTRKGTGLLEEYTFQKEDISYNVLGQEISWQETSISSQSPDKTTSAAVSITYNNFGRAASITKNVTESGTDYSRAYTTTTENNAYNLLGEVSRRTVTTVEGNATFESISLEDIRYDSQGRVIYTSDSVEEKDADGYSRNYTQTKEITAYNSLGQAAREKTITQEGQRTTTKSSTEDIKYDSAGRIVHTKDLINEKYLDQLDRTTIAEADVLNYNQLGIAQKVASCVWLVVGTAEKELSYTVTENLAFDEKGKVTEKKTQYFTLKDGSGNRELAKYEIINIDSQSDAGRVLKETVTEFNCDDTPISVKEIENTAFDANGNAVSSVVKSYLPDDNGGKGQAVDEKVITRQYDALQRMTHQTIVTTTLYSEEGGQPVTGVYKEEIDNIAFNSLGDVRVSTTRFYQEDENAQLVLSSVKDKTVYEYDLYMNVKLFKEEAYSDLAKQNLLYVNVIENKYENALAAILGNASTTIRTKYLDKDLSNAQEKVIINRTFNSKGYTASQTTTTQAKNEQGQFVTISLQEIENVKINARGFAEESIIKDYAYEGDKAYEISYIHQYSSRFMLSDTPLWQKNEYYTRPDSQGNRQLIKYNEIKNISLTPDGKPVYQWVYNYASDGTPLEVQKIRHKVIDPQGKPLLSEITTYQPTGSSPQTTDIVERKTILYTYDLQGRVLTQTTKYEIPEEVGGALSPSYKTERINLAFSFDGKVKEYKVDTYLYNSQDSAYEILNSILTKDSNFDAYSNPRYQIIQTSIPDSQGQLALAERIINESTYNENGHLLTRASTKYSTDGSDAILSRTVTQNLNVDVLGNPKSQTIDRYGFDRTENKLVQREHTQRTDIEADKLGNVLYYKETTTDYSMPDVQIVKEFGVNPQGQRAPPVYNFRNQLVEYYETEQRTGNGIDKTTYTHRFDIKSDVLGRTVSFTETLYSDAYPDIITTTQRKSITYNGLGQIKGFIDTVASTATPDLATTINRSNICYDQEGLTYSYTQTETRKGPDFEVTTTTQRISSEYNAKAQLIGHQEIISSTDAQGLKSEVATEDIKYNSSGQTYSYAKTRSDFVFSEGQFKPGEVTTTNRTATSYDSLEQVTGFTETITSSATPDLTTTITRTDSQYNSLGLLDKFTQEENKEGSGLDTTTTNTRLDTQYNDAGQVISSRESISSTITPDLTSVIETSDIVYNSNDQLYSYTKVKEDSTGITSTITREYTTYNAQGWTLGYRESVVSTDKPALTTTTTMDQMAYSNSGQLISYVESEQKNGLSEGYLWEESGIESDWQAIDFDGDGDADLVRNTTNAIEVRINNGGSLEEKQTYTLNAALSTGNWAYADLNADGLQDILIYSNNKFEAFLGNGNGFDSKITWSESGINSGYTWKTGDFNADGKTDIIITEVDPFPENISVNNYAWIFPLIGTVNHDFDGDGKTDTLKFFGNTITSLTLTSPSNASNFVLTKGNLAWTRYEKGIQVRINSGSGFQVADSFSEETSELDWMLLDINDDGKTDLVKATGGKIEARLSTGTSFEQKISYSVATQSLTQGKWALGDFNGDGNIDFAKYTQSTTGENLLEVSLNGGQSFETFLSWTLLDGYTTTETLSVADFNDDGLDDIIRHKQGGFEVLFSNGSFFTEPEIYNWQQTSTTNRTDTQYNSLGQIDSYSETIVLSSNPGKTDTKQFSAPVYNSQGQLVEHCESVSSSTGGESSFRRFDTTYDGFGRETSFKEEGLDDNNFEYDFVRTYEEFDSEGNVAKFTQSGSKELYGYGRPDYSFTREDIKYDKCGRLSSYQETGNRFFTSPRASRDYFENYAVTYDDENRILSQNVSGGYDTIDASVTVSHGVHWNHSDGNYDYYYLSDKVNNVNDGDNNIVNDQFYRHYSTSVGDERGFFDQSVYLMSGWVQLDSAAPLTGGIVYKRFGDTHVYLTDKRNATQALLKVRYSKTTDFFYDPQGFLIQSIEYGQTYKTVNTYNPLTGDITKSATKGVSDGKSYSQTSTYTYYAPGRIYQIFGTSQSGGFTTVSTTTYAQDESSTIRSRTTGQTEEGHDYLKIVNTTKDSYGKTTNISGFVEITGEISGKGYEGTFTRHGDISMVNDQEHITWQETQYNITQDKGSWWKSFFVQVLVSLVTCALSYGIINPVLIQAFQTAASAIGAFMANVVTAVITAAVSSVLTQVLLTGTVNWQAVAFSIAVAAIAAGAFNVAKLGYFSSQGLAPKQIAENMALPALSGSGSPTDFLRGLFKGISSFDFGTKGTSSSLMSLFGQKLAEAIRQKILEPLLGKVLSKSTNEKIAGLLSGIIIDVASVALGMAGGKSFGMDVSRLATSFGISLAIEFASFGFSLLEGQVFEEESNYSFGRALFEGITSGFNQTLGYFMELASSEKKDIIDQYLDREDIYSDIRLKNYVNSEGYSGMDLMGQSSQDAKIEDLIKQEIPKFSLSLETQEGEVETITDKYLTDILQEIRAEAIQPEIALSAQETIESPNDQLLNTLKYDTLPVEGTKFLQDNLGMPIIEAQVQVKSLNQETQKVILAAGLNPDDKVTLVRNQFNEVYVQFATPYQKVESVLAALYKDASLAKMVTEKLQGIADLPSLGTATTKLYLDASGNPADVRFSWNIDVTKLNDDMAARVAQCAGVSSVIFEFSAKAQEGALSLATNISAAQFIANLNGAGLGDVAQSLQEVFSKDFNNSSVVVMQGFSLSVKDIKGVFKTDKPSGVVYRSSATNLLQTSRYSKLCDILGSEEITLKTIFDNQGNAASTFVSSIDINAKNLNLNTINLLIEYDPRMAEVLNSALNNILPFVQRQELVNFKIVQDQLQTGEFVTILNIVTPSSNIVPNSTLTSKLDLSKPIIGIAISSNNPQELIQIDNAEFDLDINTPISAPKMQLKDIQFELRNLQLPMPQGLTISLMNALIPDANAAQPNLTIEEAYNLLTKLADLVQTSGTALAKYLPKELIEDAFKELANNFAEWKRAVAGGLTETAKAWKLALDRSMVFLAKVTDSVQKALNIIDAAGGEITTKVAKQITSYIKGVSNNLVRVAGYLSMDAWASKAQSIEADYTIDTTIYAVACAPLNLSFAVGMGISVLANTAELSPKQKTALSWAMWLINPGAGLGNSIGETTTDSKISIFAKPAFVALSAAGPIATKKFILGPLSKFFTSSEKPLAQFARNTLKYLGTKVKVIGGNLYGKVSKEVIQTGTTIKGGVSRLSNYGIQFKDRALQEKGLGSRYIKAFDALVGKPLGKIKDFALRFIKPESGTSGTAMSAVLQGGKGFGEKITLRREGSELARKIVSFLAEKIKEVPKKVIDDAIKSGARSAYLKATESKGNSIEGTGTADQAGQRIGDRAGIRQGRVANGLEATKQGHKLDELVNEIYQKQGTLTSKDLALISKWERELASRGIKQSLSLKTQEIILQSYERTRFGSAFAESTSNLKSVSSALPLFYLSNMPLQQAFQAINGRLAKTFSLAKDAITNLIGYFKEDKYDQACSSPVFLLGNMSRQNLAQPSPLEAMGILPFPTATLLETYNTAAPSSLNNSFNVKLIYGNGIGNPSVEWSTPWYGESIKNGLAENGENRVYSLAMYENSKGKTGILRDCGLWLADASGIYEKLTNETIYKLDQGFQINLSSESNDAPTAVLYSGSYNSFMKAIDRIDYNVKSIVAEGVVSWSGRFFKENISNPNVRFVVNAYGEKDVFCKLFGLAGDRHYNVPTYNIKILGAGHTDYHYNENGNYKTEYSRKVAEATGEFMKGLYEASIKGQNDLRVYLTEKPGIVKDIRTGTFIVDPIKFIAGDRSI